MANACAAHAFGADPNDAGHDNVLPGDVVMHTVDVANGDPTRGQGNYAFVSKSDGAFSITGMVWNAASLSGRAQAWLVMHNARNVASGSLDGRVSRIRAQRFNAPVTLRQGDTIRLEFARASGADYGYFVGVNLSVVGDVAHITRVLVEGHTDDRGALDHNMKLSTARAQSVTTWLEQHGTPAALLETKGLGSSLPKYPNTNEEHRSHNRRVEISVLK